MASLENISTTSTAIVLIIVTVFCSSAEGKVVCEKTTLYSFIFPPQKEPASVLCHPVGQELKKADNSNIAFNSGVVAAHTSAAMKCPSHDKEFCAGWEEIRMR